MDLNIFHGCSAKTQNVQTPGVPLRSGVRSSRSKGRVVSAFELRSSTGGRAVTPASRYLGGEG